MTPQDERELFESIGAIRADVKALRRELLGNGQPGRVGVLEDTVLNHTRYLSELRGKTVVLAAIVAFIASAAMALAHSLLK